MLLSFIPSALLQNSLNCDRKYLDNKISSVEITGQMGLDRAVDREKERETDCCTVVCELSRYETVRMFSYVLANLVRKKMVYFLIDLFNRHYQNFVL